MNESVKAKAKALESLNELALKNEIVVFGSTYMANFPFYELVNKYRLENALYNRSIANMTLDDALEIVESCVLDLKPDKVFVALGENDYENADAIKKYNALIKRIRSELPQAKLYLICLWKNDVMAKKFNENIYALSNHKNIFPIKLTEKEGDKEGNYKLQFKELSCFFHDSPLNMADAFLMAT